MSTKYSLLRIKILIEVAIIKSGTFCDRKYQKHTHFTTKYFATPFFRFTIQAQIENEEKAAISYENHYVITTDGVRHISFVALSIVEATSAG